MVCVTRDLRGRCSSCDEKYRTDTEHLKDDSKANTPGSNVPRTYTVTHLTPGSRAISPATLAAARTDDVQWSSQAREVVAQQCSHNCLFESAQVTGALDSVELCGGVDNSDDVIGLNRLLLLHRIR